MPSAVAKPLSLRLFLEGEEIPVIAAQVSINTNGAAVASIQVVPLDEATQLKPRTMVHLFFLEVQPRIQVDPQTDLGRQVGQLSDYKLLFAGEVVGFQYAMSPMQRSVVLQCMDFSSYYDACHVTTIDYGPNGNAFVNQSALYGSNSALFDNIASTQKDRLVGWLNSTPQTPGLEKITGLAGGIIRMLEAMGGVPGHSKGVNDFFSVAELRCRLLAQITAEEGDSTAKRLLSAKVFEEWLMNGLQNIGLQVTFRDMLLLLFRYIYYDIVPNPAAKFDRGVVGTSGQNPPRSVPLTESPSVGRILSRLPKIAEDVGGAAAYSDPLAISGNAKANGKKVNELSAEMEKLAGARSDGAPSLLAARSLLSQASGLLSAVAGAGAGAKSDEMKGKMTEAGSLIFGAADKIQGGGEKVMEPGAHWSTGSAARLRSQIIRPDCWFVPPPRCNVIFPEHYASLNYDRGYLGEVTRVLLSSYNTLVGNDSLLNDYHLAPNLATDLRNLTKSAMKKGGSGVGYRTLMDHERHTGIVPRSEWLPNTASAVGDKADPENSKRIRGARNDWSSRIALFHFFKYRFATRQASISGRFNPYVVCGFPAVVIRTPYIPNFEGENKRPKDESFLDDIHANAKLYGAPAQILGMVAGVNHSVSQEGGLTSVTMHHARHHLGVDDEFLSLFSQFKEKKRVVIRVPLNEKTTSMRPELRNILISVTPQEGAPAPKKRSQSRPKTSEVTYATTQYVENEKGERVKVKTQKTQEASSPSSVDIQDTSPPWVAKGRVEGSDSEEAWYPSPPGKVTVGSKGVFGTIVGIEVPGETPEVLAFPGGQMYAGVVLYEEVQLDIDAEVPVENIIRPSWFTESYSNRGIGKKIYEPFFGTGSVVDELLFEGLGSGELGDTPTVDPGSDKAQVIADLASVAQKSSRASIERSVNLIGYYYGVVKSEGYDVDEFVRSYSARPIASIEDILGSGSDKEGWKALELKVEGTKVTAENGGRLGFHTLSVHSTVVNAGKLVGLVEDPDLQIRRINGTGAASVVPEEYDVRKEKRERVEAYIRALQKGPGFRG